MPIPNYSLEGKVAVISGARMGLGEAIALIFAEAGADIAICDINTEDGLLSEVSKKINDLGKQCFVMKADVSKRSDVERFIQGVIDEFGFIDILVNNVGVWDKAAVVEADDDHWNSIIDINLKSQHMFSHAVAKKMMERRTGNIINMTSVISFRPRPDEGAYAIAKTGVNMLTRTLALELAGYNIRVNAIAPGTVNTHQSDSIINDPEALKERVRRIPMGRLAEPSEIASVALFLATEASSYMTGSIVLVDGGIMDGAVMQ